MLSWEKRAAPRRRLVAMLFVRVASCCLEISLPCEAYAPELSPALAELRRLVSTPSWLLSWGAAQHNIGNGKGNVMGCTVVLVPESCSNI